MEDELGSMMASGTLAEELRSAPGSPAATVATAAPKKKKKKRNSDDEGNSVATGVKKRKTSRVADVAKEPRKKARRSSVADVAKEPPKAAAAKKRAAPKASRGSLKNFVQLFPQKRAAGASA